MYLWTECQIVTLTESSSVFSARYTDGTGDHVGLEPPALEWFTISSTFHWAWLHLCSFLNVDRIAKSNANADGNHKINKSLSMFWPAVDFLLTASQDNCCRLHDIGRMAPKFRKMRIFPTFWTGLRSGVLDTRNAEWLHKMHEVAFTVYTRRDIAAQCRDVMDAENGLQRNQQGRLH